MIIQASDFQVSENPGNVRKVALGKRNVVCGYID
jgi:hypothetical protein